MAIFTRIQHELLDTVQVSQILYDDIPVFWIEHVLKRVIVSMQNDWYYVDGENLGENLTIRKVIEALGHKRCIVSWASHGERYDVLDQLVINAPQNTIRIFSNPVRYLEYSEYDDIDLE